jgi:hypothetical protein
LTVSRWILENIIFCNFFYSLFSHRLGVFLAASNVLSSLAIGSEGLNFAFLNEG